MIVHVTGITRRAGLEQERLERVLGLPNTTKDAGMVEMGLPPTLAVMEKEVVMAKGVVEKVNDAPPFDVDKAETGAVAEATKSEANAVVTPKTS